MDVVERLGELLREAGFAGERHFALAGMPGGVPPADVSGRARSSRGRPAGYLARAVPKRRDCGLRRCRAGDPPAQGRGARAGRSDRERRRRGACADEAVGHRRLDRRGRPGTRRLPNRELRRKSVRRERQHCRSHGSPRGRSCARSRHRVGRPGAARRATRRPRGGRGRQPPRPLPRRHQLSASIVSTTSPGYRATGSSRSAASASISWSPTPPS